MDEYPIYASDGEEELGFMNKWRGDLPQVITNVGEGNNPYVVLNPLTNFIALTLTEEEFVEIFTALYVGAEFAYPEKYLQILFNFLKGIQEPASLDSCFEYPTYASFIQYSPISPYIDPDAIPEGYLTPPFQIDGENGVDIPNYEHFDILIPFDAITLDVNWFEDISGQLPTITIAVEGTGKVIIRLLNQIQGGLAVITVDNPPNILDIIGGIVTGADNILDLNLDVLSLPPETAIEIDYPVDIETTGSHLIYVVYLPILDDSLIPLRFGGGFRGVQLCNMETPTMGIQNIRFDDATCELQTLNDGVWEQVAGWENWLDCVPSGGGGGGGGGGALATVHKQDLGAATVTSTSTTVVTIGQASFNHTFTKTKAIVILHAYVQHSGAAAVSQMRVGISGATATDNSYQLWSGTNLRVLTVANSYEDISAGIHIIDTQWLTSGGTMTWNNSSLPQYVILEFDDASELFVEDVRIVDGELQKKMGGAWIPVTESLASLLDAIAAAAAAAQVDANTALTQNIAQQTQINAAVTVNNLQNTRLDNLEDFQADAALSFLGIQAQLDNHEARLDALEASSAGGVWSHEFDFTSGQHGWSGNPWVSSLGFIASAGTDLDLTDGTEISDGRITHIKFWLRATSGGSLSQYLVGFPKVYGTGAIKMPSTGTLVSGWYSVPSPQTPYNANIEISLGSGGQFQLERIQFLGRGNSPW